MQFVKKRHLRVHGCSKNCYRDQEHLVCTVCHPFNLDTKVSPRTRLRWHQEEPRVVGEDAQIVEGYTRTVDPEPM